MYKSVGFFTEAHITNAHSRETREFVNEISVEVCVIVTASTEMAPSHKKKDRNMVLGPIGKKTVAQ